jgi:hypothetical protein
VIPQDQRRREGMESVVPEPLMAEEGIEAEIRISVGFSEYSKETYSFWGRHPRVWLSEGLRR